MSEPVRSDAHSYWQQFCQAAGIPPATPFQAWYFGDSPQMAHELVELVLHGTKRATAGSMQAIGERPEMGAIAHGYSVVTEFDGRARAVIRTTSLDVRALDQVDAQFAWDEGEGDRTLADWLDGHRRYFRRECERLGLEFSEALPVQLERFELLYPFDNALAVPDGPRIVPGYLPGAVGAIAELHGRLYARDHGFGAYFEAKVARECAEFCSGFDPSCDGLWLLVDSGRIHGSIVIDGSESSAPERRAHLRWFVIEPALHGRGLGARMLAAALAFCRDRGFAQVVLTTFAGLDAARALYDRAGFTLVAEADGATWGRRVCEQRFELTLQPQSKDAG